MLELKNIKKDYVTSSETVKALRGVDITFRDKEFVSILGPSGCGKTTLLNIVGGLDHYTSGDLIINGRSTKSYKDRDWDVYRNHRVGFIFQSYNLIPHQTVLGNVELALTISGVGKKERIERAKQALDRVGLGNQYNKKPNQLSGGQCQRVAIARALVNDPEILLADEPTGALDTVTSVQIMELIAEIARERLVIMVTHNPELAEQYSTRIIKLLDGNVVEDSDPVSQKEVEESRKKFDLPEKAEVHIAPLCYGENDLVPDKNERRAAKKAAAKLKNEKKRLALKAKKESRTKKEKAKMSILTTFKLSAKNLISKKARTTMVGIAGSIGIIGIAMVLAFSSGIKGYVKSMQDDMLSGNPVKIIESSLDFNALTTMMSTQDKIDIIKDPGKVYINSIVEYIASTGEKMNSMVTENDITKEYVEYVKSMPKEYYSAMLLDYGIDMSHNIYTEFKANGVTSSISISALTNIYTAILQNSEYSKYASTITSMVPTFTQAPNDTKYIAAQYDVIGEIADEYNEVMLVLDKEEELSDVMLARLGYYTQEEFFSIIDKASGKEGADLSIHRDFFTHDELIGRTFTWYPNDAIFTRNNDADTMSDRPFYYAHNESDISSNEGVELTVVGILYANEFTTYGCLSSGIYYTEALTEMVLKKNMTSELCTFLAENQITNSYIQQTSFTKEKKTGIYYEFDFTTYDGDEKNGLAFVVNDGMSMASMISGLIGSMGGMGGMGGSSSGSSSSASELTVIGNRGSLSLRNVGGVDLANDIALYPIDFDSKDLVTDYLDAWNESGDITVNGQVISDDARPKVNYTDALELVINLINGMIDVVSAALIAFTSISLVVSTVMIGIITYVSVVERIKEIGVIRSLGGRKKDVSRLFTAETFIIGLLAGLIGVLFTYLAAYIASIIVYELIAIPNIAMLEVSHAILLVALSVVLTLFSGVMPARSAARKDPVVALRTE